MVTANETSRAIFGAFCLAKLDARGMEFFDRSVEGARNSFFAAVLILPFYAILQAMRLWPVLPELSLGRVLTVQTLAYTISWTAFPVLMLTIAWAIGRQHRYLEFLVAYNWSNIVQIVVLFPLVLITQLGLWPRELADTVGVAAVAFLIVYEWFVIRTSLETSGVLAVLLTVADLTVSWLVAESAAGMIGYPG